MLELTINLNNNFRVGDNVLVYVKSIEGGSVSLGIRAPRSVAVDRHEIYLRKQKEKLKNNTNDKNNQPLERCQGYWPDHDNFNR